MKKSVGPKPELFRMSAEVWDSLSYHDVIDTAIAMAEMEIFYPPYRKFDVECDPRVFYTFGEFEGMDKEMEHIKKLICHFDLDYENNTPQNFRLTIHGTHGIHDVHPWSVPVDSKNAFSDFYLFVYCALVVVLASKNVEKKQVANSDRSRNHKERTDSKNYASTTTIRVGRITEYVGNKPESTGRTVRAHLRRGHIKGVRVGEGRTEIKKVFIHPTFVNADRDWVAPKRESYKVSINGKKIGL